MLDVPFPPRRSHIRAFWWTFMLFLALLLIVLTLMTGWPGTIISAGVPLAGLLISGAIGDRVPSFFYRLWFHANKRFALAAQTYVAALIHFLVFTSAPRAHTELQLEDKHASMWRPYPMRPMTSGRNQQGWITQFLDNTRIPERRWWLFLLPLLLTLSLFRAGQAADAMPENIYTLF